MMKKAFILGAVALGVSSAQKEIIGVYMKPDLNGSDTACKAKNCFAKNCKTAIDGLYDVGKCTNISGCTGGDDKTNVKSVAVVKVLEAESTTKDVKSQVTNTEAWERVYDQNNKFTYKLRMFQLEDCKIDDDNAELTAEVIDQDVYGHGGVGIRVGPTAGKDGASFYTTTVAPHDYELKMRGVLDYWVRAVGLTALLSFLALFALVGLVLFTTWTSLKMKLLCSELCKKRSTSKEQKYSADEKEPISPKKELKKDEIQNDNEKVGEENVV